MTTEEKLDRLTERTDALTHSVELLASLHHDNEVKAAEREAKADERAAKMDRNLDRVVGLIENLGNISWKPRRSPS
jgi:hypothetical protein